MSVAQVLIFAAIAVQSLGKVLYGTFLSGISTPLFVLVGVGLTAAVFLGTIRGRMPADGCGLLVLLNASTAVAFIGAFFALKHLPPAMFGAIEIGTSLAVALGLAAMRARSLPPRLRLLAGVGILGGCILMGWSEIADAEAGSDLVTTWMAIGASAAVGAATVATVTASKGIGGAWLDIP